MENEGEKHSLQPNSDKFVAPASDFGPSFSNHQCMKGTLVVFPSDVLSSPC